MPVSLSVVVPVKDEAENVAPLAREIAAAVSGEAGPEIIFVDDGSTDGTAQALATLKAKMPNLRVILHGRNTGQSRAIRTGVRAARAEIVATLDGDGQNDPADIPALVAQLRAGNAKLGMVGGVRANRQDTLSRRLASSAANAFRRAMLGDDATDTGCGIKAFRREAYLALPFFDHQHRFMINLFGREGYDVQFLPVNHRARLHGQSKYTNFHRMLAGVSDLRGVRWLAKRYRGHEQAKEI